MGFHFLFFIQKQYANQTISSNALFCVGKNGRDPKFDDDAVFDAWLESVRMYSAYVGDVDLVASV